MPLPDPSPTGEGEEDRLPNMGFIDMHRLTPNATVSDIKVPVEGGELTLEFRRTLSVGNRMEQITDDPEKDNLANFEWPINTVLGRGWASPVQTRAVITFINTDEPPEDQPSHTALVFDDLGNGYAFYSNGGATWIPDIRKTFSNDALRATLANTPNGLVFRRTFGTTLYFETFPGSTIDRQPEGNLIEVYHRAARVVDRNGNALVYEYLSGVGDDKARNSLPSRIYEATHPARQITFSYTQLPSDLGIRLATATDPLGRMFDYNYDSAGYLSSVLKPEVKNPSGSGMVRPETQYTYHVTPNEPRVVYVGPSGPDFNCVPNYQFWFAPATITDPRGHVTTFSYTMEQMPSAIRNDGIELYEDQLRLTSAETVDGIALFETVGTRSFTSVTTRATDTRGVETTYVYTSSIHTAPNEFGFGVYVDEITRSVDIDSVTRTVTFTYSGDANGNLVEVEDISGNVIRFEYESGEAGDPYDQRPYGTEYGTRYQVSNQPARMIVDPAGLNIATEYRYEAAFNKMTRLIDGEGVETIHEIDANGNRIKLTEAAGTLNKVTQFTFDSSGFITQNVDGDGRVTNFAKDSYGNLRTTSVVGYQYNPLPVPLVTETQLDVMGRELERTDPKGNVTKSTYDNLDRKLTELHPPVENPADPEGPLVTSQSEWEYDLNSNLILQRDDNGNVTVHQYDLMNRKTLTRVRMADPDSDDPSDLVTQWAYNEIGLNTKETDPLGRETDYEYDEILRLTKTIFPEVTLPGSGTVRYEEIQQYGANSGSGAFTLGGFNPVRVINKRGYATDYTFDAAYRQLVETRRLTNGSGVDPSDPPAAGEPSTSTEYNKANKVIKQTVKNEDFEGNPADQRTFTFYDHLYRQTVTAFDFDGSGGVGPAAGTFVDDPATFVGQPGDFITRRTFDLEGNLLTETDPEGNATNNVYDGAKRLTETIEEEVVVFNPNSGAPTLGRPTVRKSYDLNSNVEIETDANGNRTRHFYDSRNREIKTVVDMTGDGSFAENGTNIVTRSRYDLTENVLAAIDGRGNATDNTYDRAYRLTHVEQPAVADAENGGAMTRPETVNTYDKNSNLLTVTDARDVVTKKEYDELNRERFLTNAFGTADAVVSEKQYDGNDNVVAVILHNVVDSVERPQETTYEFNPLDRQVKETLPDIGDAARETITTYDRVGNVQTVTDPKAQLTETEYDLANRATMIRFADETRTFTYDKVDNLRVVTDLHGTTTRLYDKLYRLASETRYTNGQSIYFVQSDYDAQGNRTRVAYPETGRAVMNAYDRVNRLVRVDDASLGVVVPGGGSGGGSTGGSSNGSSGTGGTSGSSGWCCCCGPCCCGGGSGGSGDETGGGGGPSDNPTSTAPLKITTYGYDHNSNRTRCRLPNGVLTFVQYDALNRPTLLVNQADSTNVYTVRYTYDLVGNRRSADEDLAVQGVRNVSYDYDDQYRLISESWPGKSYAYAYDPAGNRLSRVIDDGTPVTTEYEYDDLNRLLTATTGAVTTTYAHDRNGNRTQKSVGGVDTVYTYDAKNRLIEVTENSTLLFEATYDYRTRRETRTEGSVTTYYRYDGGLCCQEIENNQLKVEFIRGADMGGGIGSILYSDRSGDRSYFTYNAIGDTVALTNDFGAVGATYRYEAFGNLVSETGSSPNDRLKNTKERDTSTGLYNYGFRYYDPEVGRFLTRDPLGYADGPNVYVYGNNNPVNKIDPQGLWFKWKSFATALVVTAVVAVAVVAVAVVAAPVIAAVATGGLVAAGVSAATAATAVSATGTVLTAGAAAYGTYQTGKTGYEVVSGQEAWTGRQLSGEERSAKLGGTLGSAVGAPLGTRIGAAINRGARRFVSGGPNTPPPQMPNPKKPDSPVSGTAQQGAQEGAGRGLGAKAPSQVAGGSARLQGQYVDDIGQAQPWDANYDQYGRQVWRNDFTDLPAGTHPNPHYHVREFGRGQNPYQEFGPIPGTHPDSGYGNLFEGLAKPPGNAPLFTGYAAGMATTETMSHNERER